MLLVLAWTQSSAHDVRIPGAEIDALRAEAAAGDESASYELAVYFARLESGGFEDYLFFLRLAAEQGHCLAMSEYARFQRSEATPQHYKAGGNWDERWRRHCLREPEVDTEQPADNPGKPGA